MAIEWSRDEVFTSAVAGLPKVAELIATLSSDDRRKALEAVEKSYLETAQALGYEKADALVWAEAVMFRLRPTQPKFAA
jgi:hypothetical protein